MKNFLAYLTTSLLALAVGSISANEPAGDFALIDADGAFHHMTWYDDHPAVVILPQHTGTTDAESLANLLDLNARYEKQGVAFFLLNPGQKDREAVRTAMAAANVELPVLMDDTQLVAERLGLSHYGQAVVYDPESFEVLYRGPVNEQLESSLQQVLADTTPEFTEVTATGAAIDYSNLEHFASPSYADDIAPLIAENCAECHREGGIAPFAMDSNLAVRGWSKMIREAVITKRMPPGQIDNKVGYKMENEMNLSDEEMLTLISWINAGSQVQGDKDPLTELSWPDTKWKLAELLGEPDLIVKIPPQTIPATGVVDYMNIPIDLGLTEDRWVRASEVAPDKAEVLHHIITNVVPPEGAADPQTVFMAAINSLPEERAAAIRAELFAAMAAGEPPDIDRIFAENPDIDLGVVLGGGDPNQASVAGFAPGNSFSLNPDGVGGLLRAGSQLNLQMHYTTYGKETTDATELAIYFYPQDMVPEERMAGGVANAFSIAIPPQAKDHEMQLITHINADVEIYDLMPHMHFRGKRMQFTARYPDGSEELLLSVPAYSFNWQLSHVLQEPLRVPAGTKILAHGAFDNSSQNSFNPDPNIEVNWGEQSWDEMFMGFYTWKELNQQQQDSGGQD